VQGFFDIPTDNLYAAPIFCRHVKEKYAAEEVVIISPDVGGVVRARVVVDCLDASLAIIDKRRAGPGQAEAMHLIGDVTDMPCIIIDDIIDSGSTLYNAAESAIVAGASSVDAYITHGVLSGDALRNVENAMLDNLYITDSIAHTKQMQKCNKLSQLTIAPLLAEAILCISEERSVSQLFSWKA
jgi:ribose-phosphate pyrophosphokinase